MLSTRYGRRIAHGTLMIGPMPGAGVPVARGVHLRAFFEASAG